MNTVNKILHSKSFGDYYKPEMTYKHDWIVNYANSLNPSLVIDAGCGRNMYKGQIKNLIGFDSGTYQNADFKSNILDANFDLETADIVMALGSVQFISLKYIRKNLEKIVSWTKPGGHLIMRATVKDDNILQQIRIENKIKLVPWPEGFLEEVTKKLNLEIVIEPILYDATYSTRNLTMKKMHWVWRKNV
jgi:hypothetical protein